MKNTLKTLFNQIKANKKLEIRKSQDLAKDFGERQVTPRRKFVNQKLWAIYRNILYLKKHVKPKIKTKRKEKKRSEDNKVLPRFELELLGAPSESFATRPRGTHRKICRNFIIKTFEPYETWIQRYFSEEWPQCGQWKPNVNAFHRIYE